MLRDEWLKEVLILMKIILIQKSGNSEILFILPQQLTKFSLRVASYFLLLRHEYPSTDEEHAVHVQIEYPDVEKDLNRWLPLIKWLFVFPHMIALCFIMIWVLLCTILAWFIILVSGKYPRSMFDFVVGAMRWGLRVSAYSLLLSTDKYPPFRFSEWIQSTMG